MVIIMLGVPGWARDKLGMIFARSVSVMAVGVVPGRDGRACSGMGSLVDLPD